MPSAGGGAGVVGSSTGAGGDAVLRRLSAGAAGEVTEAGELAGELIRVLSDANARGEAGANALKAVAAGRGATARTVGFLESIGVLDGASG